MIPEDPNLLLSYINLKLRDFYPSLAALCEDLEVDEAAVREKLLSIHYQYDEDSNRFVGV